MPEQVIESELFGHVKGAFTGAWKDKKGLVAEANGGTLFLDEIGDLKPVMQTKLLRLLQEGEYKPVGAVADNRADLRFIAATNHNLIQDMKEKLFREDLFYRLDVVNIELPPLRERKGDIPLLSYYFLKKHARLNRKNINHISPMALRVLTEREFPGNVRELENIIERGVIFCKGDTLEPHDLFINDINDTFYQGVNKNISGMRFREAKERALQLFHRRYIESILSQSGGNISKAAEIAGIQRQYLHRLMKDANIDAGEFKKS